MAGAVSTLVERLRNYAKNYKNDINRKAGAQLMAEATDMLEHQMLVIQNNNFDRVAIREMDTTSIEVITGNTDKVGRIFLTEKGTHFTKTFYQEQSAAEDVCEWIKYDYRTLCPKYHDVDNSYWRIPMNMDKLKYCPYCGRKIKFPEPYREDVKHEKD